MRSNLTDIARSYDTDKGVSPNYLESYEGFLSDLREEPIRLLELCVLKGGSLLMWAHYFKAGTVVGVDINPCPLAELPATISFHQGSQADGAFLAHVAEI